MLCWFCAKAARGTCRFCGRGVCEDHARFGPYLLEVHRSTARNRTEGLVVEDAAPLWNLPAAAAAGTHARA